MANYGVNLARFCGGLGGLNLAVLAVFGALCSMGDNRGNLGGVAVLWGVNLVWFELAFNL